MFRLVLIFRSQFFHNLRHFSSQAKERSTTHLFGITLKVCNSLRFATSTVHPSNFFTTPANFTGLPAVSFPAGYNSAELPIGIQAIGRHWQEHTLLRLALAGEHMVQRRIPKVFYDILEE